ncbi:MAG: PQQ-like beta-propeller repeat protein [candidate division KSB1 bacterium]|nr:PQQ-like beta-propeller repeat protein [candidate division KSB1 bacterium]MDZ7369327.1 PQQ-like beta-propeller repeat protein [candidate division KSB1 bacterium]MDZ7407371.1 PQQ-like beta-propeller repeat protein [candidate division KSB1 bacterium]
MSTNSFSITDRRPRWWPAFAIAGFTLVTVISIWTADFSSRQMQVQWTLQSLILAILLLLVWLLFFSRLSWKMRLISAGAVMVMLGLIPALFRMRGVSGDILPILEWRWAKHTVEALPPSFSSAADTMAAIMPESEPILPQAAAPAQHAPEPAMPAKKKSADRLSQDYPQFLGPNRDAKVSGVKLRRDWSKHPPQRRWRQPIGAGWSAFAVAGNLAITQEQRGAEELVVAYDLKTGRVKWRHGDSTGYISAVTGDGPRATPTISGNRVYTLGGTGMLNCLDLKTGQRLWSKNIIDDNDSQINTWGMSGSPLVIDSLVVINAGGRDGKSLAAYHRDSGAKIWNGGSDRTAYSSPLITTLAGIRQILIFNQNNVVAHDPASGQILWQHAWPSGSECVAQPVPLPDDRVFVSSGYGIGCKLFHIQRGKGNALRADLIWQTNRLKAKFTNVVHRDGYIYGLDDGILVCLDLTDGERKWKAGRYGHGQMIGVDDLLLIQAESGDVVLVEANPEAHHELARFAALNSKTWNNPALAGKFLLVRNDREAACYELPLENEPEALP